MSGGEGEFPQMCARAREATAFYAGLRRGELQALRWSDVSFDRSEIRVVRSWDAVAGYIEPKSKKGTRTTVIVPELRAYLLDHQDMTGRGADDLVFGSTATRPFTPNNVRRKALAAWEAENKRRTAEAEEHDREPVLVIPVGLHALRHGAVTYMSEAGLSLEEIGDLVGHSSAYMSDRYRHPRDERRAELAVKLAEYVQLENTAARIEQLDAEQD